MPAQLDPRYRWFRITFKSKSTEETLSYIFRGFTLAEMRRAGSKKTASDSELFLLETCVQDINIHTIEHGVADRLLSEIYHVSGWNQHAHPFKAAAAWLEDSEGCLEAAAVVCVHGLTFDILDHCDPADRAKYLILGRILFKAMFRMDPEEAFTPEDKNNKSLESLMKIKPKVPGMENLQEIEGYSWRRDNGAASLLPDQINPDAL